VLALILAVGDAANLAHDTARAIGIPPDKLPFIYILGFGIALLLIRAEYEAADYDFVEDPDNAYVCENEYGAHHEIHRISVKNFGRSPISVRVLVDSIDPLPPGFAGKLGMPLVPKGATKDADGTVVVNPGLSHAFNFVTFDFSLCDLSLRHAWRLSGAPSVIKQSQPDTLRTRRHFVLTLSPAEGQPKSATFALERVREWAPLSATKAHLPEYQLTRVVAPSRVARFFRWLEQPVSSQAATPSSSRTRPQP
jgi:hypothetical protein